tara:strand:- start:965 stop:1186 length:222 start_codon:yes stop_codon:yes gene_type:complete
MTVNKKYFRLNKDQFRKWDIFCTKNGSEMYKNKDVYEVNYDADLDVYDIGITFTEQSGMNNFLINLTTEGLTN